MTNQKPNRLTFVTSHAEVATPGSQEIVLMLLPPMLCVLYHKVVGAPQQRAGDDHVIVRVVLDDVLHRAFWHVHPLSQTGKQFGQIENLLWRDAMLKQKLDHFILMSAADG